MVDGVEPEVEELTDRIAAVRTAIEEEKQDRADVEATQLPAEEDPTETALEALRDEVTAARAKLTKLQAQKIVKRGHVQTAGEASERSGLYCAGSLLALPGLFTVVAMVRESVVHPEEALAPMIMLVLAIPFLFGLLQLVRARFAPYHSKRDSLGWNFFG